MMLAGGVALWLCVSAQPAAADKKPGSAGELRVQGELLGKEGRFEEAIQQFKKAEALEPVPENDCFVAISYARLEKWTQAKLFIERCRSRTAGVPKLPWYGQAESLINTTLSKKGYAAILLRSAPLGARAHLDGTPEDETFETPISLWLPEGSHTIEVEKNGFVPLRTELVTVAGERRTEELVLKALNTPSQDPSPTAVEPPPVVVAPPPLVVEKPDAPRPRESHLAAWLTLGGGGTVLAGGIVAHASAYSARSRAQDPLNDYDAEIATFKSRRLLTFSLYGVAGVLGGVGTYLLMRESSIESAPSALSLSVEADPSGATVGVGGRF